MDAVTYPNESVADFISGKMIPLRVAADAKPLSADFNVVWTPTLITLDSNGKEHHRTVGFFPPEELVPSLILGMGKCDFELDRFDSAIACFDSLLAAYPKSAAAPEAIYLRGVSLYKSTHEAGHLKKAYEHLVADYPNEEWTRRAKPYSLL